MLLVIDLPALSPIKVLSIALVKELPALIPKIVFPCGLPDNPVGTKPEYNEAVSIKKG